MRYAKSEQISISKQPALFIDPIFNLGFWCTLCQKRWNSMPCKGMSSFNLASYYLLQTGLLASR